MNYFIEKIYKFYPQISQVHVIYYLEKIYNLKISKFYSEPNLNLIDFLKLRNFYSDLLLLNKRPQNHKNKNIEEKLLVGPQANGFQP